MRYLVIGQHENASAADVTIFEDKEKAKEEVKYLESLYKSMGLHGWVHMVPFKYYVKKD